MLLQRFLFVKHLYLIGAFFFPHKWFHTPRCFKQVWDILLRLLRRTSSFHSSSFPFVKSIRSDSLFSCKGKHFSYFSFWASDSHFLPVFKCAVIDLWHVGGAARRGARLKVYRLRFMAVREKQCLATYIDVQRFQMLCPLAGLVCESYFDCVMHCPEKKCSSGGEPHGLARTLSLYFYLFNHRGLMTSKAKGLKTARASTRSRMTSWTSAGIYFRSSLLYLSLAPWVDWLR